VIAIWGFTPGGGEAESVDTLFGAVEFARGVLGGRQAVFLKRSGDARALVAATVELGAQQVIAVFAAVSLRPELSAGVVLTPVDVLDQTRSGPTTFFEGCGLGYVQMTPPFCPQLRATLASGLPADAPADAIVAACPARAITPAEARAWSALGADVAVWGLAPEWNLARELERCYAPLLVVGESTEPVLPLLENALMSVEHEPRCGCSRLNPGAHRALGDERRAWVRSGAAAHGDD
jgi:5'-methylthioadenosine phosphorylase